MKKLLSTLFAIMVLASTVFAQAPKGFNYQMVVRNNAGQLVSNKNVSVRLRILQGSETGTAVYQLSDNFMTNANGLVSMVVGAGSAEYAAINWGNGPYYIVSEVDPNGGSDFTLRTVQQILAVPYAEYASVADHVSSSFVYDEQDPKFTNWFASWGYAYDSLVGSPTKLSDFINDLGLLSAGDLFLSLSGNTLCINGVSCVTLPETTTIQWDSVINRPTNLSQFNNDLNLSDFNNDLTIEWDSVLNHPTNLSQFTNDLNLSDFNNDLTIEWDSVLNHPTNLSQFVNDLNLSDFNNDLNLSDFNNDLTIEWDSVLNHPTNLSQFVNDLNLSDFNNDLNLSDFNNDLNLSDFNNDLTIEWDSVLNHPTRLSQFTNDLNLSDFTNDLNLSDFNNDLSLTDFVNDLTIEWDSVLNHPTRLSQFNNDIRINWDSIEGRPTDLSQFVNNLNVEWDSITNRPTNLSQFTNDLNLSDFNNDLNLSDFNNDLSLTDFVNDLTIEWDSVLNHPTNLSQFTNDLNLSDFTNDLNLSDFNNDLSLTDFVNDLTIEWDSVLNHPTNLSQFTNDLNLSDFNNDLNLSDFNNDLNLSDLNNDLTLADVLANSNSAAGMQIKNLAAPTAGTDAVNKDYVDNSIADLRSDMNDSLAALRGELADLRDDINDSLADLRNAIDGMLHDSLTAINNRIDSLENAMNNALAAMDSAHQAQLDSLKDALFDQQHERIEGELTGVFSIGPNTKARFSKGNLQYKPRTKTWRFAPNQYDIAGNGNNAITSQVYCTSWLDLFGFGTSGWDGGATNYMPYSYGTNDVDYFEIGSSNGNDLVNYPNNPDLVYANADWGYYNPIINGGNKMGTWRTMTNTEWQYLLSDRDNAVNLRGCATIEGIAGYVLLPDDWVAPVGVTFVNIESDYNTNSFNAAQWATMEAAGAVFLPAAGMRTNTTTTSIGVTGYYWSTKHVNLTTGRAISIAPSSFGPGAMPASIPTSQGCSVRVIREYK